MADPRIFISYARGDGRDFAIDLRQKLENEGFPLWQDLADMEGGRDWWRQITEAIDACEYLVLVLTPRAVASKTVRREWRYARQQGRCVVPVFGAKGLDLGPLPRWMRDAHVYDLDEPDQVRRLTRQLEGPCEATRVPRMVEELSDDFVERPAELESLVAKLLDEAREEPVAITAALKGAGGYGKTTLARALCHHERVQDAFHDGILWVTLGEAPGDLTARLKNLIYVLTGKPSAATDVETAKFELAPLLDDRRLLIVIDDVWHRADAEPFLQGGKTTSARLITNRNRDTLPAGAAPVDVEEMRAREAVALLRFGLPEGEDPTFQALVARLGEWPLLLKLANGALRGRIERGQALPDALAWVGQALDRRGVQAFDPKGEAERRNTADGTLEISLDQLDPDERTRLTELAVFPEDLDVPLAAVERLWQHTGGVDPFDAEEILTRLFDLSLLLRLDRTS